MKVDRNKAAKIFDAIDEVCINCVENIFDFPEICESCPVRKLHDSLDFENTED